MKTTIQNEFLTVTIDSKGAEITSIKSKGKKELLWQDDKDAWDRQAPVLFPWTGRIVGKKYSHNGKDYDAPIHGFLRDLEHNKIESESRSRVTFSISFNDEQLFPFPFYVEQSFSLEKQTLSHFVKISNTGELSLPFGFGFHPGFLCPFSRRNSASDYVVQFDSKQEAFEVEMVDGHPNGKQKLFLQNTDVIPLSDTFFKNDSVCLTNITAKEMHLIEKGSNNRITINIEGFPYVLLWSFPTPPLRFVCIEPWHTLPDFFNSSSEWSEKKNLLQVAPKTAFETTLNMSFFFE